MNDEPTNVWQFLIVVWKSIYSHGTRILGLAVGTLTVLTSTGIVPESHLKYYLAAIAILTYWRGQGNADKIAEKTAAKIVAATPPFLDPSSPEIPK